VPIIKVLLVFIHLLDSFVFILQNMGKKRKRTLADDGSDMKRVSEIVYFKFLLLDLFS